MRGEILEGSLVLFLIVKIIIIIIIVKPIKITMVTDKKECTNLFCSMISMGKVIKKNRSNCYK